MRQSWADMSRERAQRKSTKEQKEHKRKSGGEGNNVDQSPVNAVTACYHSSLCSAYHGHYRSLTSCILSTRLTHSRQRASDPRPHTQLSRRQQHACARLPAERQLLHRCKPHRVPAGVCAMLVTWPSAQGRSVCRTHRCCVPTLVAPLALVNTRAVLQQAGHEVLQWSPDIGDASEAAVPREPEQEGAAASSWAEALASATAVFHVLHGHEQHARTTLLELARTAVRVRGCAAAATAPHPVTSEPLPWCAPACCRVHTAPWCLWASARP
jgi:hypothetical protein